MSNVIALIVVYTCLLYVQALSNNVDLQRAMLARIPHTNPQKYYFLFINPETETESPPAEEMMNEVKRSVSDDQPIILTAKNAKRRMYARIGKRQTYSAPARVGR